MAKLQKSLVLLNKTTRVTRAAAAAPKKNASKSIKKQAAPGKKGAATRGAAGRKPAAGRKLVGVKKVAGAPKASTIAKKISKKAATPKKLAAPKKSGGRRGGRKDSDSESDAGSESDKPFFEHLGEAEKVKAPSVVVRQKMDLKKVSVDDYLTNIQYMKVLKVEKGGRFPVAELKTQSGEVIRIDGDILSEDSFSADHFKQAVNCTMTELVEVLESAGDTIFKISFKKKVSEGDLASKLAKMPLSSAKNLAKIKALHKEVEGGQLTERVCHLVNSEQHMGRTLAVDLEAEIGGSMFPFILIDHRTIQWIILRNVKYQLGKKSAGVELPVKFPASDLKWDLSKLKKDNWFSEMCYYRVEEKLASDKDFDLVVHKPKKENYLVPNDQVELMVNGSHYDSEEKASRSNVIELLLNAKETAFTVTFNKKIDTKKVEEHLRKLTQKQLKDKATAKKLMEDVAEECTLTGFLKGAENGLGRVNMIDLKAAYGFGYRQVDLRTVKALILKGVKYTVK